MSFHCDLGQTPPPNSNFVHLFTPQNRRYLLRIHHCSALHLCSLPRQHLERRGTHSGTCRALIAPLHLKAVHVHTNRVHLRVQPNFLHFARPPSHNRSILDLCGPPHFLVQLLHLLPLDSTLHNFGSHSPKA